MIRPGMCSPGVSVSVTQLRLPTDPTGPGPRPGPQSSGLRVSFAVSLFVALC